ncbi:MAG: hypothetical protein WC703_06985 [Candidatus Neomarinimicrobiota bacterium]
MIVCSLCGNEIEFITSTCPFCGNDVSLPLKKDNKKPYEIINLEYDLPTVQQALLQLETAIHDGKRRRTVVLKLIHGYGSHGVGGDIRYAVLQSLVGFRKREVIADFIPGDEVVEQHEKLRALRKKFHEVKNDPDTAHPNAGVTFVILRRI